MRVAALYDIHGNLAALDAVLGEVLADPPDAVVLGGDLAAGPMPAETLDRLLDLTIRIHAIQGNADRELLDPPSGDDVWSQRARWAASKLTPAHRALLAAPPLLSLTIDGLGPTLFCHGSPRSDEEIITRLSPERRIRPMLRGVRERLIVCGHTHVQFDREVACARIVNAGSVGMAYEGTPGARWAMVGPVVCLRTTPYDLDAAAGLFARAGMPAVDELVAGLRLPPSADEASGYFERTADG